MRGDSSPLGVMIERMEGKLNRESLLTGRSAPSAPWATVVASDVFWEIIGATCADPGEWAWIRGAVVDAVNEFRLGTGWVKPASERAIQFGVRKELYLVMRRVAGRVLDGCFPGARASGDGPMRWEPGFHGMWYTENESSRTFKHMAMSGCYRVAPKALADGSSDPYGEDDCWEERYGGREIGVRDRLGYDERNDTISEVLTLHGEDAEIHCRDNPAQS